MSEMLKAVHRARRRRDTGEKIEVSYYAAVGPSIMIYTPEGKVGAFQVDEYTRLIRTAFKAKVRQGLGQGRSIENILMDL